ERRGRPRQRELQQQAGELRRELASPRRKRPARRPSPPSAAVRRLTDSLQKLQSSSNPRPETPLTAEIASGTTRACCVSALTQDSARRNSTKRDEHCQSEIEAIRQLKEELKIANPALDGENGPADPRPRRSQSQRQLEERRRRLSSKPCVSAVRSWERTLGQREGQWRAERAELMDKCHGWAQMRNAWPEELAERQAAQERLHSQVLSASGSKLLQQVEQQLATSQEESAGTARTAGRREAAAASSSCSGILTRPKKQCRASAEELSRLESKVQAAAASGQSAGARTVGLRRLGDGKPSWRGRRRRAARQQEARSRLEERCAGLEKQAGGGSKSAKAAKAESARLEAESCSGAKRRENGLEELRVQTKRLQEASRGQQQELSSRAGSAAGGAAGRHAGRVGVAGSRQPELSQRLMQRDDLLARLSGEDAEAEEQVPGSRCRSMTQEMTKQSDTIKRCRKLLRSSQLEVEEVKRRSEEELANRERTIKSCQEDLLESQSQYSQLLTMRLGRSSHPRLELVPCSLPRGLPRARPADSWGWAPLGRRRCAVVDALSRDGAERLAKSRDAGGTAERRSRAREQHGRKRAERPSGRPAIICSSEQQNQQRRPAPSGEKGPGAGARVRTQNKQEEAANSTRAYPAQPSRPISRKAHIGRLEEAQTANFVTAQHREPGGGAAEGA
uniref:Kinesin motor domain-containing protein n=1 Tax=Macrostomum lignano TaxID=282301 RepID=A0A1I8F4H9_9PLAT